MVVVKIGIFSPFVHMIGNAKDELLSLHNMNFILFDISEPKSSKNSLQLISPFHL